MKLRYLLIFIFSFLLLNSSFAQDNFLESGSYYFNLADRYEIYSGKFVEGTQLTSGRVQRKHILNIFDDEQELTRVDAFNINSYLKRDLQFGRESDFPNFSKKPFYKNIYSSPAYLIDYYDNGRNYRITLNPVLALSGGKEIIDGKNLYRNTRGLELKGFIGKKQNFGFYSFASENQQALPSFVDFYTDSLGFLPGETFWKRFKTNGYDFFQARGYIWYDVNDYVTLRFGQDKHFWGNGMRSLILGNNTPPHLFLQADVNLGIFNYQTYYAQFSDLSPLLGSTLLKRKFGTFHRLGVNVSKNLNIGVFEAIMFDRQDSTESNRYDIAYLNPVIFFRPVEQQLGSRDNAVVGLDWKWNFLKRFQFYGQFVLDEFKKDELFENKGWWANKYALQTGLKYINVFGVNNLDFISEYNYVRPYTYSHFRSGGNWAHYGQPLAHPFGANFEEVIVKISYQPIERLFASLTYINNIKGEDFYLNGDNYGGNILRDYASRINDYGNSTLQGMKLNSQIFDVNISYMLWHNFFLDGRVYYKLYNIKSKYPDTKMFSLGLRWNIDTSPNLLYY